jgi:hypothetical protein
MRKLLLILFSLSILIIGCNNNHNTTNAKPNLSLSIRSINDTTEILKKFFSPVKIVNKNLAVWKPDMDDYFNMVISDDSTCKTKIDTIINLKNQKYVVIFRTDGYYNSGKKRDCHVCSPVYGIATIEKQDSTYNILNFKKNLIAAGSFGSGYDTLQIEKFGHDFQLLRITSSYVGTSTETLTNTYFDVNGYKQLFSYWPYRTVGDSAELDTQHTKIEQQLIHIPGKEFKERDDIKLLGYFTTYDEKKKKFIRRNQTQYYRADAFGNYKRALQ